MPMLWGANFIGWSNAAVINGQLEVNVGFVNKRPRDPEFRRELHAEIARLTDFLQTPGA